MEENKHKKTIAIDFDGVLADYKKGYQGKDVFGDVVEGASSATKVLKENGWRIIIYTTRPATDALKNWLNVNEITYDYINENPDQPKESEGCKLIADIYVDDRGIQFNGNWKCTIQEIPEFNPWCNTLKDELKDMRRDYKNIFKLARSASDSDSWPC